jgi:hypothetical protein
MAERLFDGLQQISVCGKTPKRFLRDLLAVDPHAELAAAARLEIRVSAKVLLDERRRTGGAR